MAAGWAGAATGASGFGAAGGGVTEAQPAKLRKATICGVQERIGVLSLVVSKGAMNAARIGCV